MAQVYADQLLSIDSENAILTESVCFNLFCGEHDRFNPDLRYITSDLRISVQITPHNAREIAEKLRAAADLAEALAKRTQVVTHEHSPHGWEMIEA